MLTRMLASSCVAFVFALATASPTSDKGYDHKDGLQVYDGKRHDDCLYKQTFTLPPLPYGYAALEPAISEAIMFLHHDRHHATYVANLNQAVRDLADAVAAHDLKRQIAIQSAIKFNGGGHINHSLFWKNLAPIKSGGGSFPSSGPLAEAVHADFGSLHALQAAVNAVGLGVEGSGWAWLAYNNATRKLEAIPTANQDVLLGYKPLLGIDIWEHAYYLDYKNVRAAYLHAIWTVINWKTVERRFIAATRARH